MTSAVLGSADALKGSSQRRYVSVTHPYLGPELGHEASFQRATQSLSKLKINGLKPSMSRNSPAMCGSRPSASIIKTATCSGVMPTSFNKSAGRRVFTGRCEV
eukprot:gnl/TRDRNA2_/TRDRNA2_129238_c0_seq1.p1 gnl/TRDRNA2_/TRDRNA2_129238_c0~~gnl/TRDRNA2_/TRDRNA2_129238_c0_seq1.p1  ORF type:complete len:103 (+),score=7.76 gnl/TRDRNA2_/TRDRNA2_129238_c0_seq1:175-483(+)